MKAILSELFYGNISPDIDCRRYDQETKRLMAQLSDHYDSLAATLTPEQKVLLEKLDDCHSDLTNINECAIFTYAFRLGARLMLATLLDDTIPWQGK